jgi:uncharacterized hydantoinase/oxoprolinase family protein
LNVRRRNGKHTTGAASIAGAALFYAIVIGHGYHVQENVLPLWRTYKHLKEIFYDTANYIPAIGKAARLPSHHS